MAASAGAWYRVGKVNVVGGSQSIVGVGTNWQSDVIAIAIGDAFTLDAKTWYEVIAVNSDTSITLDRGFEGSTGTDKAYAILRNTSGTILTRIAGQVSVQFNQKQLFLDELRTWLNSDNETEELTDSHGLKQSLKTPSQMVRDHDNKLAELDAINPHPYAMRKVDFELNRLNTKRLYDASGFLSFGLSNVNSSPVIKDVGNGLFTREFGNSLRTLILGANRNISNSEVTAKHDFPKLIVNGVTHTLGGGSELSESYGIDIHFPDSEDGTRTVNKTTGQVTQHSTAEIAFSFEDDDNEVIYKRVDLWGIETFLRAVSESDPFVYRYGYIQSAAADINGVETTQDNVRPDTYFQQFEGDTRLRRQGVNWFLATESQKIKIASDPENNIYYDDSTGLFHQFCFRVRTFAGRGNAEWSNIDSSDMSTYLNYKASSPAIRVTPQGVRDSQSPLGSTYPLYSARDVTNLHEGLYENYGAYGAISDSNQVDLSSAVNGECYFYVGGTVSRLNKGAYHPSFNHLGTAYSGVEGDPSNRVFWEHASSLLVDTKSCFINVSKGGNANGSFTSTSAVNSRMPRPDDRFHDIIYPGGFGGVSRDMRMSAKAFDPSDFAGSFLELFRGHAKGVELIPFTYVTASQYEGSTSNTTYHPVGVVGLDDIIKGKRIQILWVVNSDAITKVESFIQPVVYESNGVLYVRIATDVPRQQGSHYVLQLEGDFYISGEFQNIDIVGHPSNVVSNTHVSGGWYGSWVPHDTDITTFQYSKRLVSALLVNKTYDNGDSWSLDNWNDFNSASNSRSATLPSDWLSINSYQANANLTDYAEFGYSDVSLLELSVVYATSDGYHSSGRGALLKQSLTNETEGTSSYSNGAIQSLSLSQLPSIDTDGRMVSAVRSGYIAKHDPIVIDGSNGVKVMPILLGENRQQFMYFAFAELKNTGAGWGDDGQVRIAGGLSFFVDDNGATLKYGVAKFVKPLGWIKNDK